MAKIVLDLKELFREKGFRYTLQREKILDILTEKGAEHLKAGDIYELVKAKYPDIGMATVYRALQIFDELHIINKLWSDDKFNRYEFNTGDDTLEHHHLICLECGRITEVKESFMNEMSEKVLNKYGFIAKGYNQKLYGMCIDCLKKEVQTC